MKTIVKKAKASPSKQAKDKTNSATNVPENKNEQRDLESGDNPEERNKNNEDNQTRYTYSETY